jgi:TIR domain
VAHDVFISYSSNDKPIADGICASLEAAGIRCWIAPRDLVRNRDARKATERAIAHSRVLVLVFSAHANASDEITRELYLATQANAVLIPVKIDDTAPVLEKQYYLGRPQWHTATNPPTAEQMQLLVERVRAVRAVPIGKPKRWRLGWFDFAPSVLIVLGLLAGLVLVVASAQLGLLRLPFASAAPTPTQTLVPSRTITPSATDQARAFAAPILAAIANKPPNFQDDFGNQSAGWKGFTQDQSGYVDGEFSVVAPPAASSQISCNGAYAPGLPEFSDLVLEIDERADFTQADQQVQFRKTQNSVYAIAIEQDGNLTILRSESQQTVNLLSHQGFKVHRPADGNHVQIIVKGARIAVSANGELIALVIDPQPLQGGSVSLEVCNKSSTQVAGRFDNIKIWDISDLPSSP